MSYRATMPPMSKVQAEEFGQWLGLYAIRIAGLTIWQIGESGNKYRDQALTDTVILAVGQTAASMGAGSAGAMVGAAAGSTGCLAVFAPVAALLMPVIAPLTIGAIALQPLGLWMDHRNRRRSAETVASVSRRDPIVATEIHFGVANVSDKRRQWTEHLIGIYARRHEWYDIHGFSYPVELTKTVMNYPTPWVEQPRRERKARTSHKAGRVRGWLEEL